LNGDSTKSTVNEKQTNKPVIAVSWTFAKYNAASLFQFRYGVVGALVDRQGIGLVKRDSPYLLQENLREFLTYVSTANIWHNDSLVK